MLRYRFGSGGEKMTSIASMSKLDIMIQISFHNTGKNRVSVDEQKKMTKKELIALYHKIEDI